MTIRSPKNIRDASAPAKPTDLGREGSDLWKQVTGAYTLRSDEARALEDACRTLDRVVTMRKCLDADGFMATGSMGQPVVNPLVAEIRAHEAHHASLLSRLKLKDIDEGQGKPNTQRDNGSKRWQVPAEADGAAS